ncbi:hypothetical protein INR49_007728, partial [Caranx melampygus]
MAPSGTPACSWKSSEGGVRSLEMFVSLEAGWRSWLLPQLHTGLRGEADLSLLKPLQRDLGSADRGRGARLASTAAASWALGAGELGLEL